MVGPRYLRNFFFLVTGNPGVRFRKYDKPTQSTFVQLFDSVGFIKEKDDTATTSAQGFTKLAIDSNAISRNSTVDADGFSKVVQPHQLPNVFKNPSFPNTAIDVISANNSTGRTGGTGKDFYIKNTLAVTSTSPELVVTQTNPGENVSLALNTALLGAGKVYVNALDPTISYLEDAVESGNTCRLTIAPNGTNEKLKFTVKDKLLEMTIFAGNNAQFNTYFPGNQGLIGSCWEGWVLANGGTYLDSSGSPVTVVDMSGYFAVGYQSPGNYIALQSHVDAASASGANSVSLTIPQLPAHDHTAGTLVNSASGAHTHNVTHQYDAATENGGGPGSTMNGLECGQTGSTCNFVTDSAPTHTHTISGNTGVTGTGSAHENRPPFTIVAYVVYIG